MSGTATETNREKMLLTADHITYYVNKQSNEYSNIRLWAIQKQCPKSEAEYQAASLTALYWFYHNVLGCEYNAAVQRRIAAIELVL